MQPFGVLDRYIGKTIFTTIMMTLFMLVSLSGIIKFVDQLKKAGQGSYDALGAGMYTLLSVPKDVQIFFPMAALLGALLGLGMLAQRSELVVMQASGFTRSHSVSFISSERKLMSWSSRSPSGCTICCCRKVSQVPGIVNGRSTHSSSFTKVSWLTSTCCWWIFSTR